MNTNERIKFLRHFCRTYYPTGPRPHRGDMRRAWKIALSAIALSGEDSWIFFKTHRYPLVKGRVTEFEVSLFGHLIWHYLHDFVLAGVELRGFQLILPPYHKVGVSR